MTRRFGAQFYNDPNFFLNWDVSKPPEDIDQLKAITDATMMGDIAAKSLDTAAHPASQATGAPSIEELSRSKGARLAEVTDAIFEELAVDYMDEQADLYPEGLEDAANALKLAKNRGTQGAAEWWAGHMHGDQHVPRDPAYGHTPIIPNPARVTLDDIDPHQIHSETTFEGFMSNVLRYGMPEPGPEGLANHLISPTEMPPLDEWWDE